jgi:hypothetical protein
VAQGYTGQEAAEAVQQHGIRLEAVKLPAAKQGFVLLPRRWAVERSFDGIARFRRLTRDYERLPETGRPALPGLCHLHARSSHNALAKCRPHNCTPSIWFNTRINPEHVPFSWKILLSGYVPEHLYESGRLETRVSFTELRRQAHINEKAPRCRSRSLWGDPETGLSIGVDLLKILVK